MICPLCRMNKHNSNHRLCRVWSGWQTSNHINLTPEQKHEYNSNAHP